MKREHKAATGIAAFLLAMTACGFIVQGPRSDPGPVQVLALGAWPDPRQDAGTRIIIPVMGVSAKSLKDSWGAPRGGGRSHQGIDIMAPAGTPVLAATSGRIVRLYDSDRGGTSLYQVDDREEHIFYYAHLDRYADGIRPGMRVRQGQVIAYVGATGNAPVPHLHFEIQRPNSIRQWWRGKAFNPYPALRAGVLERPAANGPLLARMR